ncbi:hypothetical protein HGRIS_000205 [Hohenbuehelia grisea]|uniref:Uncharacterized protein n=1 Tax=Hohenbuehelia grisea TaxID=104357 RepID=A0ABR3JQZ3_9AGAR
MVSVLIAQQEHITPMAPEHHAHALREGTSYQPRVKRHKRLAPEEALPTFEPQPHVPTAPPVISTRSSVPLVAVNVAPAFSSPTQVLRDADSALLLAPILVLARRLTINAQLPWACMRPWQAVIKAAASVLPSSPMDRVPPFVNVLQ